MKTWTMLGLLFAVGCGAGQNGQGTPPGMGGGRAGSPGAAAGAQGASGSTGMAGASGAAGVASGAGGSTHGGIEVIQQALSGSRLKAYWYTADDGAKQFALNWYDSTLQMDCYFSRGADGVTRCLPSFASGPVLYSDAGCLTPVAVAVAKSCTGTAPKWASVSVPDTSGASCASYKTVYYNVGGAFSGSAFFGTPGSSKTCLPLPTSADAGYNPYPTTTYDLWSVGTALDLTMFQVATYAHD